MKNKLFVFLILLASATGLQAQINDPNAQVRTVGEFHAVKVSGGFNVYLSQGTEQAVAVSAAREEDLAEIKTEVKNGVLIIGMNYKEGLRIGGSRKLKAYIGVKNLDAITLSGACDLYTDGTIKLESLAAELSGASDMKGQFELGSLDVHLSGASDMQITGTVKTLRVEASGASDFKGYDLATETSNVKASGASDIHITVSKELSAEASGASDVRYRGDAVVKEEHVSGASSVKKVKS